MTIDKFNFAGKKAFVRVDFNVPLDENFNITDDTRIRAALPTLKKILADGGSVIIGSHLGRPKGVADKFSLKHIVKHVSDLLGVEVQFANDCMGEEAAVKAAALQPGEVLLLENLRFYAEEEGKPRGLADDATDEEKAAAKKAVKESQKEFTKKLASYADCYVNDAFGTAHRAHASNVGISANVEKAVAGFLLENEIAYIKEAVETPERPFVAILGGSKVSDKIGVIENLLAKADKVLIGGGMTYTFYKAQGIEIGNSLVEEDKLDVAKALLEKSNGKLILPVDSKEANAFADYTEVKDTEGEAVDPGFLGLDIGPKSIAEFDKALTGAKTVVWNGPMGVFENPDFQAGTIGVMDAIVKQPGVKSIIGGGDSAAAAINLGRADKFSWISTGGGASMELLEGKELPGLAALTDK